MKYKKLINLLENTPNQPTKFKTKNWAEINDDARGMYGTNSQFKFKNLMLKPLYVIRVMHLYLSVEL